MIQIVFRENLSWKNTQIAQNDLDSEEYFDVSDHLHLSVSVQYLQFLVNPFR